MYAATRGNPPRRERFTQTKQSHAANAALQGEGTKLTGGSVDYTPWCETEHVIALGLPLLART